MRDLRIPDVQIDSVTFTPRGVEVSWSETSDQNADQEGSEEARVVLLAPEPYEAEIGELLEAAQALVDAYLLRKRNPPNTIRAR